MGSNTATINQPLGRVNPYITATLIEDESDMQGNIEVDTTTLKPTFVVRVSHLSMHLTRDRVAELRDKLTEALDRKSAEVKNV